MEPLHVEGSDSTHAVYRYAGRPAQAVMRLKYDRHTSLARWMAEEIAQRVSEAGIQPDLVVPVPIHPIRRSIRGFNQAELLCEALASVYQVRRLLVRRRHTSPQASLGREQRQMNLVNAFGARGHLPRKVLVVDDVLTTGATLRECARVLREVGVTRVDAVTLCATLESEGFRV